MPNAPSITFLYGTDEYAINAHIRKICAALGDPATADMNLARFDGRQGLDYEAFNSAVNSVPFLSPRRVVVLFHPSSVFAHTAGGKRPAEAGDDDHGTGTGEQPGAETLDGGTRLFPRKKFIELLENAQPTTNIVLVEPGKLKDDHWLLKWTRRFTGQAQSHVYNLPARQEMSRWIEVQAKELGGMIEPAAAARLHELVGEDSTMASQELTKLITYVNGDRPITLADVDRVSIDSAPGNIFDLVDALGMRDGNKAQGLLHRLLEQQEIFPLWGMVIRQFRLVLQARELLDEGANLLQIQKALGFNYSFMAENVTRQARLFSLPVLECIYHKLLEIDEAAKTSQVPLDLALDLLVVELARQ